MRGDKPILHHADSNWLYAIGRVKPGTNIGVLQAKLSQYSARLALHTARLH